jgi:hypothetical protein
VSVVGTADADALPTSEKVNPTAPKAGTAFVTRFRFEACFTPGIVAPPYLQKNVSGPANSKLRECTVQGWLVRRRALVPEFMFMNDSVKQFIN